MTVEISITWMASMTTEIDADPSSREFRAEVNRLSREISIVDADVVSVDAFDSDGNELYSY